MLYGQTASLPSGQAASPFWRRSPVDVLQQAGMVCSMGCALIQRWTSRRTSMRIALVSSSQSESLVDLLCEINAYYNPEAPATRAETREHALHNLLSQRSPHRLVVASLPDGKVVGLAAITLAYSLVEPAPDRRAHCQLKELYVSSSQRSRGVGRALMAWVAKYAIESGCHRIDWPVKSTNTRGIAFYKSLAAFQVEDRLSFRLVEPALTTLAASKIWGSDEV
jgi:ribosomal protein S18 acetylase RimI-like enzyme